MLSVSCSNQLESEPQPQALIQLPQQQLVANVLLISYGVEMPLERMAGFVTGFYRYRSRQPFVGAAAVVILLYCYHSQQPFLAAAVYVISVSRFQ